MKKFILGVCFFLLFVPKVLAASNYVLPYPGLMPGHRLYLVKQIFDQLRRFWAFGSFSRHKYELDLADKKLVEAKILFEYQQYFLGMKALGDSNEHFQLAAHFLEKAAREGKDISQKEVVFQSAAEKHRAILEGLQTILPKEFLWQPEKEEASQLEIEATLKEAIKIREV